MLQHSSPRNIMSNMRKPSQIILLSAVMVLIMTACATTDRRQLFGSSPIALVSVVANNDINWKDEGPVNIAAASRSARRTMEEDPDQNMVTSSGAIINEVEALIRSTLESSPFISFVPGETVLRSRSYNNARPNAAQEKDAMAKPADYRYINFRDKSFFADFGAETGINKTLFVSLDLTKAMSSGFGKNGSFRVNVSMSVMLVDERGKRLFYKVYTVPGRDIVSVSGGMYSQSEIRRALLSAIGDACYFFLDDLAY